MVDLLECFRHIAATTEKGWVELFWPLASKRFDHLIETTRSVIAQCRIPLSLIGTDMIQPQRAEERLMEARETS
jgi:hypothetical protein